MPIPTCGTDIRLWYEYTIMSIQLCGYYSQKRRNKWSRYVSPGTIGRGTAADCKTKSRCETMREEVIPRAMIRAKNNTGQSEVRCLHITGWRRDARSTAHENYCLCRWYVMLEQMARNISNGPRIVSRKSRARCNVHTVQVCTIHRQFIFRQCDIQCIL